MTANVKSGGLKQAWVELRPMLAARRMACPSKSCCPNALEVSVRRLTVIPSHVPRSSKRFSTNMSEALQQLILDTLDSSNVIKDTRSLVLPEKNAPAVTQDEQIVILGALNSLLSRDVCPILRIPHWKRLISFQMITYQTNEILSHVLTPEGAQIALQGSHEARVWAALPAKGEGAPLTPQQLKKQVGDEAAKVGQGRAFKNGWIGKEGEGLVKLVRFS
jgi:phenylalanyl-tRNA synthetase alpha chain